jgi:hypothetical protein
MAEKIEKFMKRREKETREQYLKKRLDSEMSAKWLPMNVTRAALRKIGPYREWEDEQMAKEGGYETVTTKGKGKK